MRRGEGARGPPACAPPHPAPRPLGAEIFSSMSASSCKLPPTCPRTFTHTVPSPVTPVPPLCLLNSYTAFKDQLECRLLWEVLLDPPFWVIGALLSIFIQSYTLPYGTNHSSN